MRKVEDNYIFLFTVKDLKHFLTNIPDDVKLYSNDADLGGYDVCENPFINPTVDEGNNRLYLGHKEYEIYQDNKKLYEKYFRS